MLRQARQGREQEGGKGRECSEEENRGVTQTCTRLFPSPLSTNEVTDPASLGSEC